MAVDATALSTSPLRRLSDEPTRVFMPITGIDPVLAREMSLDAIYLARQVMPKLSGASAKRLTAFYGENFFGISFPDPYVWYQEQGINPFTMYSLAGKTIPMWIADPYGTERAKNPKAKTRVTESGVTQILIFRKAAKIGSTKRVRAQKSSTKKRIAKGQLITVNLHFPGAPGRIANREGTLNKDGSYGSTGRVSKGNVPVWWRHPGLKPRLFLNFSLTTTAAHYGFEPTVVYADG